MRRTADTWRRYRNLFVGWALVSIVCVLVANQLLPSRAPVAVPDPESPNAVIVGVAGLRWDDINAKDTPALWKLAEQGAIGSLIADSEADPTCPLDGWLTLSAGAPAAAGDSVDEDGKCPLVSDNPIAVDRSGGATVTTIPSIADRNRVQYQGVEIGVLAESVRCSTAVGAGAAYAVARPSGKVDHYLPQLPEDDDVLRAVLSRCVLTVVDLGALPGDRFERAAAIASMDRSLSRIDVARGSSFLVVAGISEVDVSPHLHTIVIDGPGYSGTSLVSSGSGQDNNVALVDIGPTVVAAVNRSVPTPFVGAPIGVNTSASHVADVQLAVDHLADNDAEAVAQRETVVPFLFVLFVGMLLLFAAATVVLHRIRRGAGRSSRQSVKVWTFRALVISATALAMALPAVTLVKFVPWWRFTYAMLGLLVTALVIMVVLTGLALLAPRRRSPVGLMITVSLVGVIVVGMDAVVGDGLRFGGATMHTGVSNVGDAGIGPLGYGVFASCLLMAVGCAVYRLERQYRPIVIALVGSFGVLVVGSPVLGDDIAGAIGLTVGVCLAAGISTGGWLTFARFAWSAFAGLGLLLVLALADMTRGETNQGVLGSVLADMFSGNGMVRLRDVLESDVVAISSNPLSLLVVGAVVFAWVVLLRPAGGLKRAFGLYPSVRAGFVGAMVAALLGGLLGGSGFIPVGAAVAIVMPLAVIMSLRVLTRSHVRDGDRERADLDLAVQGDREVINAGVTVESRG